MTDFVDQYGNEITGRELFGHLKSGSWDGEQRDGGTWEIIDEGGNERVFQPIQD